ncbi:hypothetical protein Sjap_004138 [Stephania japonica]|uniref:Uncharacterized protein n=1 Tax=Stephania japonica TaxID=461633 RepID=A0AAP0PK19_9MAGN
MPTSPKSSDPTIHGKNNCNDLNENEEAVTNGASSIHAVDDEILRGEKVRMLVGIEPLCLKKALHFDKCVRLKTLHY